MTTLTFDFGYAMFQSDSALFGLAQPKPAALRHLRRLASSPRTEAAAEFAARVTLALMPFSAIAWMFIAR